ncbi:MAG: histone deacetylase [Pseudomonadota bacterium]
MTIAPGHVPIVHSPAYVAPLPDGHRFPMNKYFYLLEQLRASGLASDETVLTPAPAPRAWLDLAHDPAYVSAVLEQRVDAATTRRIGFPVTERVARRSQLSCAGTLMAARTALEHGIAINSAGGSHHAHRDFGAGFCVFNDVGVAAKVLLEERDVARILVVDLDVHQGDGTARMFQGDRRCTTFSMHCRINFPVRKAESDLDVALEPKTGDSAYLGALAEHLPPLLARAQPDLVFYNAGVDPHEHDRLGKLSLTDGGLAARDRYVINACQARAIPLTIVMGGGYGEDVPAIARRHSFVYQAAADALHQHHIA